MGFFGSMIPGNSGTDWTAKRAPSEAQVETTYRQAGNAYNMGQDYAQQAGQQGGFQHQQDVFSQMQALAGNLNQQAQGEGPNPALQQLQNTTGQNMQQQAAMMAGQRGSTANAGMMARQVAGQGADIQQQASGQAALMRAQQQIAAMQALQQQQGMMGGMANQQVGQMSQSLGNLGNIANAQQQNVLGAASDVNKVNAQIAMGNQKAQQGLLGGLLGSMGSGVQTMAKGGEVKNYAMGGPNLNYQAPKPVMGQPAPLQANPNEPQSRAGRMLGGYDMAANSQNPIQSGSQQLFSPLIKQAKKGIESLFGSETAAPAMESAAGEEAAATEAAGAEEAAAAGEAAAATEGVEAAAMLAHGGSLALGHETDIEPDKKDDYTSIGGILNNVFSSLASGGMVPAKVSPGEIILNRSEAQNPKKAAQSAALKEKYNKKVPGKAKVKGDSLKNDIVSTKLESGGIVIPRSHACDPKKAAAFAHAVALKMQQKGKK